MRGVCSLGLVWFGVGGDCCVLGVTCPTFWFCNCLKRKMDWGDDYGTFIFEVTCGIVE